MRNIIIASSYRTNGDTAAISKLLSENIDSRIIHLVDYTISPYDYNHNYPEDDFPELIADLINNYDRLIFATPVYWYSMSGLLKIFLDRMTDLITIHKDMGRKLRGKHLAIISTSNGNNLSEAFWLPFEQSADYLGMEYDGHIHTYSNKDNSRYIKTFGKSLKIKG